MAHWIRYEHKGEIGFGTLEGETIEVFRGELFDNPVRVGETLALNAVKMLTPCVPTKMIALWNNFRALAKKN
jgi:hypothetical protein